MAVRKAFAIATVLGISCIAALAPAGGGAITIRACSEGCTPLSLEMSFKPTELPQHEYAPAKMLLSLVVNPTVATTPLRLVTVEFDRDAAINPIGLPACGRKELETAQSTSAARAACPGSVVGGGRFLLGAPGNDFFPISFFAFNGGVRDGATVIYLRSQPEGAARPDLAAVSVRAIEGGRYGLRATVHVPRLSGAHWSISACVSAADFQMKERDGASRSLGVRAALCM